MCRCARKSAARPARNVCFVLCALAALVGCQEKNQYIEPPPPEVIVSLPQERDVTEFLETTGTAHPLLMVDVRARVRGFLTERLVEEGTVVRAEQLLLVIDEEPFKVALDLAQAKLAEAETALKKAQQSQAREMMRAQLDLDLSQLVLAIADERRMTPLVPSGAVTQEQIDTAMANRKKFEATVAATRANLAQVEADYATNISAASANVAAAKTAVRSAQIDLGYCRITAPIGGRIGRINYDIGNLVGDPETSLLTTIVKYDPIQVYASLSVDDFLKYRSVAGEPSPGGRPEHQVPVELALPNETGYPHRGHVDYHDPMVDKGTGTIEVRAVFPNPDGVILPGMFAHMRIPIARRANALLVPEPAIATDQLGQYVLVVYGDNKVAHRPVKTGPAYEGMRVVEGKLGPQDRVIVEGLLRARPGLKVAPKMAIAKADTRPGEGSAAAAGEPAALRTGPAATK
ncbi:MAG: efflux RND transporter periplasmic adaptor subunit [Pirellulales bacterium]